MMLRQAVRRSNTAIITRAFSIAPGLNLGLPDKVQNHRLHLSRAPAAPLPPRTSPRKRE